MSTPTSVMNSEQRGNSSEQRVASQLLEPGEYSAIAFDVRGGMYDGLRVTVDHAINVEGLESLPAWLGWVVVSAHGRTVVVPMLIP